MDSYVGRGQCPIFLEHFKCDLLAFHHNIVNVGIVILYYFINNILNQTFKIKNNNP